MICPVCYGRHWIVVDGRMMPCPECGGLGEWHCCDGLQEQPATQASTTCPTTPVPANREEGDRRERPVPPPFGPFPP